MSHVPVPVPVQQCQGVLAAVHCALFGSQIPVPAPVQHLQGWGAAPPVVQLALCGQLSSAGGVPLSVGGSPSKQPVCAAVPLALVSRQKPQKTSFWPTQVPAPAPVQQLKGCEEAVHSAFAL